VDLTVTVQPEKWKNVSENPTNSVTKTVETQLVLTVITDVKLAQVTSKNVVTVPVTELTNQPVTVQKDISIPINLSAHNVTLNVSLVKRNPPTVLLVPKEESTHQNVHVHMVTTSMEPNVLNVLINVSPVKMKRTVLNVLETELINHLALAQIKLMTTVAPSVHLVPTNVPLVSIPQKNVSPVPSQESTHQSVSFQNKKSNP